MPKHIPLRTCVACRQAKPKRSLVRVVRSPEGDVSADPTGKKAGRGAYLCAAQPCWDAALKKRLLEHAFKTPIPEASRAALEAFGRALPAGDAPAEPAARTGPKILSVTRQAPGGPTRQTN